LHISSGFMFFLFFLFFCFFCGERKLFEKSFPFPTPLSFKNFTTGIWNLFLFWLLGVNKIKFHYFSGRRGRLFCIKSKQNNGQAHNVNPQKLSFESFLVLPFFQKR